MLSVPKDRSTVVARSIVTPAPGFSPGSQSQPFVLGPRFDARALSSFPCLSAYSEYQSQ
jgi:hypothetical protein